MILNFSTLTSLFFDIILVALLRVEKVKIDQEVFLMKIKHIKQVLPAIQGKKKIAAGILLLLAILLSVRMLASISAENGSDNNSYSVSVAVEKAFEQPVSPVYTYKATLEPKEYGLVTTKIAGKVSCILFENGDAVKQGQPLIQIDTQDIENQLSSAENQLKIASFSEQKAKAALSSAELAFSRTQALFQEGAVSQSTLDAATTSLQTATADHNLAQANINAARITMQTLKDQLANATICAPISGIIDSKNVSVGQYLTTQGSNVVLAKIIDTSVLNAVIQVEQDQLSLIQVGQTATVTLDGSDQSFEGAVTNVDPSADPSSRSFECKIALNQKDPALMPGIFTTVSFTDLNSRMAITVPMDAVIEDEGKYYLYIAENKKAVRREVKIGDLLNQTITIQSGIQEGDMVIISNVNMLQDGDPIEVQNKEAE